MSSARRSSSHACLKFGWKRKKEGVAGVGPAMGIGGWRMRAFRPSRFGALDEAACDPVEELTRIAKVQMYARRAEAKQPLFQEETESMSKSAAREE